jgi:hypothetical protein
LFLYAFCLITIYKWPQNVSIQKLFFNKETFWYIFVLCHQHDKNNICIFFWEILTFLNYIVKFMSNYLWMKKLYYLYQCYQSVVTHLSTLEGTITLLSVIPGNRQTVTHPFQIRGLSSQWLREVYLLISHFIEKVKIASCQFL